MAPSRRLSNGRSPLVRKQSQITAFFTPGKSRKPSPNPSPDPSPSEDKKKQKKAILAIPPAPSPSPNKRKCYSDEVVGRRIKVFWPLDKVWYEGCIKSFDKLSGRHVVQYDDAEEEVLDLGEEKIQLMEEEQAPRSLRRLRKMSATKNVAAVTEMEEGEGMAGKESVQEETPKSFRRLRKASEPKKEVTTPELEEAEAGSSGGDGSTDDEDWGNDIGKVVMEDDSEGEIELEEEEEEEKVAKSTGRGQTKGLGSGKRKKSELGKLECAKKIRFCGSRESIAASAPPKLTGSRKVALLTGIGSQRMTLTE